MSQRLYRSKFGVKKSLGDALKDADLIRKVKLGIDPTYRAHAERMRKLLPDPEVTVLVNELKKNVGTPEGAALRSQIVSVITAARKEVALKARGVMRAGRAHGCRACAAKKPSGGKW